MQIRMRLRPEAAAIASMPGGQPAAFVARRGAARSARAIPRQDRPRLPAAPLRHGSATL
jgi:hypothetical protein